MQLKTLSLLDMQQFYPDLESFGNRAEVYQDLDPKMLQLYNDLFLKFKINNRK